MSWCPGWDLNPHSRCRKKDFKSFASADFATRASLQLARTLHSKLSADQFDGRACPSIDTTHRRSRAPRQAMIRWDGSLTYEKTQSTFIDLCPDVCRRIVFRGGPGKTRRPDAGG